MKKVSKLIFTITFLLTLMACPAAHFHEYEYIGNNGNISFKAGNIKCGFLNNFIGNKERVLIVKINSRQDEIYSVTSEKLGVLNKVNRSELKNISNLNIDSITMYSKAFAIRSESKILQIIKNDKITVELKNGLKYYFEKR